LEADISGAKLLAIIATRPAARERFLDFIYNGNHLFASKIDGQSAEGADGLTVRYQPSNLFANLLAAMRAGEREVDDHRDVGHWGALLPESLHRSIS
jgi:hypothetical protein